METRCCRVCGAIKQHSEFYASQTWKCKDCVKESVRKNRADRVDYYRAYDKSRFQEDPRVVARHIKYRQSSAGKASMHKARLKSQQKYPGKKEASELVARAIRSGKIQKPLTCSVCGKTNCRIEGHHPDYSKPLEVIWLCKKCHYAEHHKE